MRPNAILIRLLIVVTVAVMALPVLRATLVEGFDFASLDLSINRANDSRSDGLLWTERYFLSTRPGFIIFLKAFARHFAADVEDTIVLVCVVLLVLYMFSLAWLISRVQGTVSIDKYLFVLILFPCCFTSSFYLNDSILAGLLLIVAAGLATRPHWLFLCLSAGVAASATFVRLDSVTGTIAIIAIIAMSRTPQRIDQLVKSALAWGGAYLCVTILLFAFNDFSIVIALQNAQQFAKDYGPNGIDSLVIGLRAFNFIAIALIAAGLRSLSMSNKPACFVAIAAFVFYAALSFGQVYVTRQLLPIIPLLFVLSYMGLSYAVEILHRERMMLLLCIAVVGLNVAPEVGRSTFEGPAALIGQTRSTVRWYFFLHSNQRSFSQLRGELQAQLAKHASLIVVGRDWKSSRAAHLSLTLTGGQSDQNWLDPFCSLFVERMKMPSGAAVLFLTPVFMSIPQNIMLGQILTRCGPLDQQLPTLGVGEAVMTSQVHLFGWSRNVTYSQPVVRPTTLKTLAITNGLGNELEVGEENQLAILGRYINWQRQLLGEMDRL